MAGKTAKTKVVRNGKSGKATSKSAIRVETEGPKWTFLTNHAHVLIVLDAEPNLVLREVAWRVGITERAVQRIIVDLEESGFLQRERVGRQNTYKVLRNRPLRHPIEEHRKIGDLLNMIAE